MMLVATRRPTCSALGSCKTLPGSAVFNRPAVLSKSKIAGVARARALLSQRAASSANVFFFSSVGSVLHFCNKESAAAAWLGCVNPTTTS
mmetsp:Transcript_59611/g.119674  ORF Transcript_59611/g.119674 Transcript_59611/m.119674 type:complete len:90 (-) Transcript_59611:23-292(-)